MPPFDPTTQDDEVLVRDADGTFRVVRTSGLTAVSSASGVHAAPSSLQSAGGFLAPEESTELAALSSHVGDDELLRTQRVAQRVASAIIASGIHLADETLARRLEAILSARLHEVRNDIETREMLMHASTHGGLGLTDDDARRLLALLHGKTTVSPPKPEAPRVATVPPTLPLVPRQQRSTPQASVPRLAPLRATPTTPDSADNRPASAAPGSAELGVSPNTPRSASPVSLDAESVSAQKRVAGVALKKSEPVPPRTTVRLPPPPPASSASSPVVKELPSGSIGSALPPAPVDLLLSEPKKVPIIPVVPPLQKKPEPQRVVERPTPSVEKRPAVPVPLASTTPTQSQPRPMLQSSALPRSGKPVIRDVAFVPRLVGPIDELRVTRAEWERLGTTPQARAKKIEEKIERLGTTSTRDRIAGITAWRSSDVVRAYQAALAAALAQKKTLADVVKSQEYTMEDILAIAALSARCTV